MTFIFEYLVCFAVEKEVNYVSSSKHSWNKGDLPIFEYGTIVWQG